MVIELSTLIQIAVVVIGGGGAIVSFFVMQKGQNMKIEQLEKDFDELKRKQSIATSNQIKTEKDLIKIDEKLDHILQVIEEIKNRGA